MGFSDRMRLKMATKVFSSRYLNAAAQLGIFPKRGPEESVKLWAQPFYLVASEEARRQTIEALRGDITNYELGRVEHEFVTREVSRYSPGAVSAVLSSLYHDGFMGHFNRAFGDFISQVDEDDSPQYAVWSYWWAQSTALLHNPMLHVPPGSADAPALSSLAMGFLARDLRTDVGSIIATHMTMNGGEPLRRTGTPDAEEQVRIWRAQLAL